MFHEVLSALAENKEWGVIILLIGGLFFYGRGVLKNVLDSLHTRDRLSGEREERFIHVLVGFSESIPKLTNAIDSLRNWLGERFADVNQDLEILKKEHLVIGAKVTDHEGRIGRLERADEWEDDDTVVVQAPEEQAR